MAGDMTMVLRGRLGLSGAVPEGGGEALEAFFGEEVPVILAKGAPEGMEPRVEEWRAEGDSVFLTIRSTRYVRAHEALLRIRKAMAASLGKRLRLGVRSFAVDEYTVTFTLDREPERPFDLPFAKSVTFEGARCTATFRDVDEEFLSRNYLDRIIRLASEKSDAQFYEGKGEHWELLWSSARREMTYAGDPTEAMVESGWVKQGPTKGKWFYRPQLAAVMRAMERLAVEEVLRPLGFQEVIESHIVPLETWGRTGHIEGSPNEIYYVCTPKTRDPAAWEEFRDRVKVTREVDREMLAGLLDPPAAGISYAQCPVIYWSFQGATIATDSLPVLVFDRAANSCRYESGGRHGIERVDEFHRIEPVYIGTPGQLLEVRRGLIDRYARVFDEILELEWRMAWVTPFYMQQAGKHGLDAGEGAGGGNGSGADGGNGGGGGEGGGDAEGAPEKRWPVDEPRKLADALPPKGTIDFETYMPYRGSREDSEWLEFQNLTISGRIFTGPFNIKGQKDELWSGCSGIGLERWTAAFLAQKGLDPAGWPAGFREYLGDLPEGYRLL